MGGCVGYLPNLRSKIYCQTDGEPLSKDWKYPMWVMPISDFLQMEGKLQPHQVLLDNRTLRQWAPGMFTVFLSHQWLSLVHPDPDGLQMAVVQKALHAVLSRQTVVRSNLHTELIWQVNRTMRSETVQQLKDGYIWLDYVSIPQPTCPPSKHSSEADLISDMLAAIHTIPRYVQACDAFMICCPPLVHTSTSQVCDYASWGNRGWCRLEVVSWLLSPYSHSPEVIVIESSKVITYATPATWLRLTVGEGDFTVDSDRVLLRPVLERAICAKIESCEIQTSNDKHTRNFFLSIRKSLLLGLEVNQGLQNEGAQDFLEKYGYDSWTGSDSSNSGPLHFAVLENNLPAIRAASEAGADIEAQVTSSSLNFLRGLSPLTAAAIFSSPETIQCLLDVKAAVNGTSDSGYTALLHAVMHSTCAHVTTLVRGRADVNQSSAMGMQPVLGALLNEKQAEKPGILKVLLTERCDISSRNFLGFGIGAHSAFGNADVEVVNILLHARADVNQRVTKPVKGGRMVAAAKSLEYRMGSKSESVAYIACHQGSTWLHLAAYFGRYDMAKYLINASADIELRNAMNLTAMQVAHQRGFVNVAEMMDKYKLRCGRGLWERHSSEFESE